MAEDGKTRPSKIDKMPPQSIEAEMSVLGSLLLDKDAIVKVVDFLELRDFYKAVHQTIYQAIIDLFERREPADLLSVSSRLKEKAQLEGIGGHSYLTELINSVPTASHVEHYGKIVQKKRILRDLISASQEIEEMGYNEEEDPEILLDQAEVQIFNIAQKSLSHNFVNVKDTLEEAFERYDALYKNDRATRGVPTGLMDLDKMLSGLQRSDLVILAARPSLGKSGLAVDIARRVAGSEKLPVAIFSLEMSKDQVVDRLIAAQSKVDLWRLRTGQFSSQGEESDFSRIQQALGVLAETPVFIDDTPGQNILQMRAMARRLKMSQGLGLIVVDYLQLMSPRNSMASPVQQVTEISRSLKGLARELDVPVLALSQLSRAVEQRIPPRPRLSDLRESGCLTGNTLITRADTGQQITIKDLAERQIQTPIEIFGVDDEYKVKPRVMQKAFYSGKKKVYRLKMRSGRTIKASANHKFLRLDGWMRLDQLAINDHLALPRFVGAQQPKNKISDDELVFLAHLMGDGCILPKQPYHYTNAYSENIQTVQRAAKELFGIEGKVLRQKNWYHCYFPSPYRLTHGVCHPITTWFKKLGIERVHSYEKRIPDVVFECSENNIALFLRHLWSTDGNLSWNRLKNRKPSGNIYYSTSSQILANQVQHLLLQVGIQSVLREHPSKKGYRTMYHIEVEGAGEQLRFLKTIGIADRRKNVIPEMILALQEIKQNTNVDVVPKLAWKLVVEPAKEEAGIGWREVSQRIDTAYCGTTLFKRGIGRGRMAKLALALDSERLRNLAESDVMWDRIVDIEELGVEDVYDATVEGVHNFVANDIIVHNSLEQDADVVMFIYREDRYKQNTPNKNIAEIIIAKHRNGPVGSVKLFFNEQIVSFSDLAKDMQEEMAEEAGYAGEEGLPF